MSPETPPRVTHPLHALLYAVPIGTLGGLIGLGGAEFRLPLLVGPLSYSTRRAVPINLATSLATLLTALLIRSRTLSLAPVAPWLVAVAAIASGAMLAAFIVVPLLRRLSDAHLHSAVFGFLLLIGLLLIGEGLLPGEIGPWLPRATLWHVVAGFGSGLIIGAVSSLLGVAGGELIIPLLLFGFGVDIRAAGTASLLISLPTVSLGLLRYLRGGALTHRSDWSRTIAPLSLGSALGALIGGLLVGIAPDSLLKLALGIILIVSAARAFRHHPPSAP